MDHAFGFTMDSVVYIEDAASQDARRTCPDCNIRMSSLKFDLHSICSTCRGNDCNNESKCSECSDWPIDALRNT